MIWAKFNFDHEVEVEQESQGCLDDKEFKICGQQDSKK